MGVADVFFVHAMHSAGATWNPTPSVISPRPVTASTGDASRTPHERLTTRARWALPGTRCVQNALPWFMCVALTKDLVLRKGCFRVIHAHSDFAFLCCSAPISGVQRHSLSNPPETGVQVDRKDKHAVK